MTVAVASVIVGIREWGCGRRERAIQGVECEGEGGRGQPVEVFDAFLIVCAYSTAYPKLLLLSCTIRPVAAARVLAAACTAA